MAISRQIEKMMEDSIMGLPISFDIDGEQFELRPVSLGQAYLISRYREGMADNLRVLADKTDTGKRLDYRKAIAHIVAIATFSKKRDILSSECLNARADFFDANLDDDDLFKLYDIVIASLGDTERFIKASGLDYDRQTLARIARHKADDGNISFGGRTAYGSIISPACEKYGWTLDYVVWGISLTNLEMLLADAQSSCYLSKEDRKQMRVSTDRDVIDMSNPKNNALLVKMIKGN